MISFIWPPGEPMVAGTGGSETFTAGHVRELLRRGIQAQVVTVQQSRHDFNDLPFLTLDNPAKIAELPGTVVFVNRTYPVKTRNKAAVILHCVTPDADQREACKAQVAGKTIIATSIYNGQQWALYLDLPYSRMHIVLPFADPIYGNVVRSKPAKKIRILYAGRLHPEKGIYTVLEMMHEKEMVHNGYTTSIVVAGQHVKEGKTIARMLSGYPYARLIQPQKTVPTMAKLLAQTDILLMPSVYAEPFGMLSIEAQHAGCRVVASNIGGLPETNCGQLTLVESRNPRALVTGIEQAVALGQATKKERTTAKNNFTLTKSVDALLTALHL